MGDGSRAAVGMSQFVLCHNKEISVKTSIWPPLMSLQVYLIITLSLESIEKDRVISETML